MQNTDLNAFRDEVRAWLKENFPGSLANKGDVILETSMEGDGLNDKDAEQWRQRLAEKGWGAPTWPTEYGGAGLSQPEARVIAEEMNKIGAVNPIPMLAGMGVTMVGPTMLEYGTEDQKKRHLPGIASGEIRWCLGLSEPNAGSDLASLTTRAVDNGDAWIINGQKIWTSGADRSQWCGALVRTDPNVKKHNGISFLLLPMDQPGIQTRPIRLIAGASPFCEVFFNDARAEKDDMLGPMNEGWSVIKRLLQHERQSQTSARGQDGPVAEPLQNIAKRYVGTDDEGRLADRDLRTRLADHLMDASAH
ncbi:MAG: acyl-CoA dehydrogenase family protein, partial [Pseudomonadales bacterium]|nr:acyl-CoA dehydrogenase family protein [Pseudomonadales bacterium]